MPLQRVIMFPYLKTPAYPNLRSAATALYITGRKSDCYWSETTNKNYTNKTDQSIINGCLLQSYTESEVTDGSRTTVG